MKQTFTDALVDAQGRSEFIIAVVADIRGFSAFSTTNESPNIAMFIKRFYLQLINKYFKTANFVKPTGDGLLMTFSYSERDLLEVSDTVINSCFACLNDFPNICNDDPMINFSVPQAIGFGIARGTACCLYSGEEILDYSGHLLNLASRLNDLARPSGIVIDGNYLQSVIPNVYRENFREQEVYVRSIAETIPMKIFYLDNYVRIADQSLAPLVGENWVTIKESFTAGQLSKLGHSWWKNLPGPIKSIDKLKITLIYPKGGQGMKGVVTFIPFKHFTYVDEGASPILKLNIEQARAMIPPARLTRNAKITFKIEYIPKLLPRT